MIWAPFSFIGKAVVATLTAVGIMAPTKVTTCVIPKWQESTIAPGVQTYEISRDSRCPGESHSVYKGDPFIIWKGESGITYRVFHTFGHIVRVEKEPAR